MFLETERLSIRRIVADDWPSIQKIFIDQENSVYACYDMPKDTSSEAVRNSIEKWASFEKSSEHMFYAVCLENVLIGYVAFNQREKGYEIGYCFHSQYQGKGYARESISALIDSINKMTFCEFISAGTALLNTPSVKLLQSLGFKLTGTEKLSFYKDDEGEDIYFEGGIFELDMRS